MPILLYNEGSLTIRVFHVSYYVSEQMFLFTHSVTWNSSVAADG